MGKTKDTNDLEVCLFCSEEIKENLIHKDPKVAESFFPRRRGRGSRRRGGGRGGKRGCNFLFIFKFNSFFLIF